MPPCLEAMAAQMRALGHTPDEAAAIRARTGRLPTEPVVILDAQWREIGRDVAIRQSKGYAGEPPVGHAVRNRGVGGQAAPGAARRRVKRKATGCLAEYVGTRPHHLDEADGERPGRPCGIR